MKDFYIHLTFICSKPGLDHYFLAIGLVISKRYWPKQARNRGPSRGGARYNLFPVTI